VTKIAVLFHSCVLVFDLFHDVGRELLEQVERRRRRVAVVDAVRLDE
jgi:hypothetical protein